MGKSYKDLVDEAKSRIAQVEPAALQGELDAGEEIVILDVREHTDFRAAHVPGAVPIPRGVLEVRIHDAVPAHEAQIVCYCGGGGRGALATDTLRTMGYKSVRNLVGGFRGWQAAGFPTTSSDA